MHEGGDTPPASTIAATLTRSGQTATAFFCSRITNSFLPTIVVRPAASGEANSFCSAFESDRHAGLHSTESMYQVRTPAPQHAIIQ
jgi:hypothetical protein